MNNTFSSGSDAGSQQGAYGTEYEWLTEDLDNLSSYTYADVTEAMQNYARILYDNYLVDCERRQQPALSFERWRALTDYRYAKARFWNAVKESR